MINRQKLLADLKPFLKAMEADLRARCDEVAQINDSLKKEYEQAKAAERTAVTFEEWRADLITQVAVAWVLSCVFVRFLEDNALIAPPRVSGPLHGAGQDAGLQRARDERETYFKTHPRETDRDYLLAVFDAVAKLPGTKDVFGPHNPVSAYRNWLSGDAAQTLIEFFQKIDADGTGEIVHDFTDPTWDTRFLGDLYQDLSEAARKKYALLQTPIFVEEFILERTLEPAIIEFGLTLPSPSGRGAGGEGYFKMIDPACGSGHFLLGSFARILKHWRAKQPGTNDRELVNRALAAVHGVDLNPYAVAIARFRLLVAAMRECHITKLTDAPAFAANLVCGDSLLHGAPGTEQHRLGFHELAHAYQSEDLPELKRILKPGSYHAVMANPPYITVKDKALNQAYRERYPEVCHMKYSLAVPFLQRLFLLACKDGFTGQITANSFMKREFGKKLVESYLPKIDLTHVIDASGAYIPGHGTPTVILFGRNRRPVAPTIRAVMGIKGEPSTPDDPAQGLVWTAIVSQIDRVGSQSAYASVSDSPREHFAKHPWSIGGGGAAELKEQLDEAGSCTLGTVVTAIGPASFSGIDEMFFASSESLRRQGVPPELIRRVCVGEQVRDWEILQGESAIVPYGRDQQLVTFVPNSRWARHLWSQRSCSEGMVSFGRQTRKDLGEIWWAWYRWIAERYHTPLSVVYGEIATHNHFVLDRGGKVFKQSAPVIKLVATATEDDHLALLGLLNSSTACFWMRQVCFPKGGDHVGQEGARVRRSLWDERYAFNATNLEQFPLPEGRPLELARHLDCLAQQLAANSPRAAIARWQTQPGSVAMRGQSLRQILDDADALSVLIRGEMILMQEDLDWQCYRLYGLIDEDVIMGIQPQNERRTILPGMRAFEVLLAEDIAAGRTQTAWFERHGIKPRTELPEIDFNPKYRNIAQRRIEIIRSNPQIALIEQPDYKRRWYEDIWGNQREEALREWLLNRLEACFDLDGRMNEDKQVTARGELGEPRLTSVAKVADFARQDRDFMQVAEIFTGRMDFDVGALVGELVAAESVPALPVLRYKPVAMDKRAAWERTWDLQRLEDAVDDLFDVERLKKIGAAKAEETLRPLVAALCIDEQAKPPVLREAVSAAGYVAEALKQKLNLTSDTTLRPVQDAAKRAKKATVGDIPVPPKYTSADFLSNDVWRLRGKLDVPKERWVSFPHCEGEDGTLVIAWAGYDHLQMARAIAERYELAKEQEGRKLVPLLAAIGQLIPWLKQWHNEMDPTYGARMGDYFENYLAEEAKALDMNVEQVMAWAPPEKPKKSNAKARGHK